MKAIRRGPLYDAAELITSHSCESQGAVLDVEARFLSCLWWGLPHSYDQSIEAGLFSSGQFLDPMHRDLFRVLMCAAIREPLRARIPIIRGAMRQAFGWEFEFREGPGGRWDELEHLLRLSLSTAGLGNYAALIIRAANRRAQSEYLRRELMDRIADPFGMEG